MPPAGIRTRDSSNQAAKPYALDRVATGIGFKDDTIMKYGSSTQKHFIPVNFDGSYAIIKIIHKSCHNLRLQFPYIIKTSIVSFRATRHAEQR
jgi:hypothetical protein